MRHIINFVASSVIMGPDSVHLYGDLEDNIALSLDCSFNIAWSIPFYL